MVIALLAHEVGVDGRSNTTKTKTTKINITQGKRCRIVHTLHALGRKVKVQTVLFAMKQGWAYELVPSTDEAILAIDKELQLL